MYGTTAFETIMRISRKKIIFIGLIALIGIIILLSAIYHRIALWEPEQSFIALLPESPICYLTLKELEGLIQTFTRSELGKQSVQMPILAEIKEQHWWEQLVYQKLLWEYEMGGKLDMKAVKGHFGEEAILALYLRDKELSFLLISAVGGKEKLGIEAITATDVINPQYKRIQTEYNGLTINTIVGYPRDFSYTFIGKVAVLSLSHTLLRETLDIYAGKKQGFLASHPSRKDIQDNYGHDKSTGYVDVPRLAAILTLLGNARTRALVAQIYPLFDGAKFWSFGNRYEDGVIISRHRFGKKYELGIDETPFSLIFSQHLPTLLPARTAFVTVNPHHDWGTFWQWLQMNVAIDTEPDRIELARWLAPEMTVALIAPGADDVSVIPSLILHTPIQAQDAFAEDLETLKDTKISVAGKPLEFLEPQDYNGITVQPVRLRLNFLLALTGGYAVVDNRFFFSTTLTGLKATLDTIAGDAPALTDIAFSANANGGQTFIQPNLLVPELKRFLPIATVLASLSGQKLDATLIRHLTENLFPLASLGAVSVEVHLGEHGVDAELRIVLEK